MSGAASRPSTSQHSSGRPMTLLHRRTVFWVGKRWPRHKRLDGGRREVIETAPSASKVILGVVYILKGRQAA
jgi:hypothetical protein